MTPTPKSPPSSTPSAEPVFLEAEDFDELDAILDELRTRYDETPQWEFCEGFMAAVICSRRPIAAAEYLPVLLAVPAEGEAPDPEGGSFASERNVSASSRCGTGAGRKSKPRWTPRSTRWKTTTATTPR
jgi:uncharacterized protein